jgi:hypothetical protein
MDKMRIEQKSLQIQRLEGFLIFVAPAGIEPASKV